MNRRSCLFLTALRCLCLGLLLPLAVRATEDLEAAFQAANRKQEAGQFAEALEAYNAIIEAEPKADNVWISRAWAKWQLKDASGARADLAQALSLNPDNPEAYRLRAIIRYQARDLEASQADLDRAIEIVPDNAELFALRGQVKFDLGRLQNAQDDLDRAISLNDAFVSAIFLRGRLNERLGQSTQAQADYSRAIELNPELADAYNNRGWLRYHDTDWAGATADARRTIELAPEAAEPQRLLGYAAFAQGDYTLAATSLARAVDLTDDDAGAAYALYVRHFALLRSGQPDKRLATSWGKWTKEAWLQALARFIAGIDTEEQLEAAIAEGADESERDGRQCEAHFYIGLARLQAGDKSTARLRFQACRGVGQKTYIEDALAAAELKRL